MNILDTPTGGPDLWQYVPDVLVFLGGILVASIGALVTRSNTRDTAEAQAQASLTESQQTERRDTIADRDALITTLSTRMDEMQGRMDTLEDEVREVHTHNLSLTNFILRCITVLQKNGLEKQIPKPLPKGIDL